MNVSKASQAKIDARKKEIISGLPDSLKVLHFSQGMTIDDIAKSSVTRASEVDDMLKSAKWEASGGFDIWCQHEGKSLSRKEQNIERDKRLERYVQLRIEQAKLKAT